MTDNTLYPPPPGHLGDLDAAFREPEDGGPETATGGVERHPGKDVLPDAGTHLSSQPAPSAVMDAVNALLASFKSHVDGRDLLDELHPRRSIDIKRRVDGVETWFEGDWLSNVRTARNALLAALSAESTNR